MLVDQHQLTAANLYGWPKALPEPATAPAEAPMAGDRPKSTPAALSLAGVFDDPTAWYVVFVGLAIVAARYATTGQII